MSSEKITKSFTYYTVEKNKLSESLCDGIATRLLRDVKEHNNRYRLYYLQSKDIPLEEAIIRYTKSLKNSQLSRKVKNTLAEKMFNVCFFVSDPSANKVTQVIDKNQYILKSGITEENGSLKVHWVFMNTVKVEKSTIENLPIRFSKHSISRLLYRFKPNKLVVCIVNLALILTPMSEFLSLSHESKSENKEWWLYVPKVGGFLFGKYAGYLNLVTFVDTKKLTPEQQEEGEENLNSIQIKDSKFSQSIIEFFDYQQSFTDREDCQITTITS